jgi:basic membrane protein A
MSERSGRPKAWSVGLAAMLLVGSTVPALAQSPGASTGTMTSSITKMAYISPEQANDYGWNQQGAEGAQAAADSIGAELEMADGSGYDDPTPILHQLGDNGAQLIIAQAGGYSTPGSQYAHESNIPVIVYDRPDLIAPGLVGDIATDSQQGGYLAGVLAATMSKTGTLGVVLSADDTNWHKQEGGFIAGALATNPDIKFAIAQIGPAGYGDAPGGKSTTESVIAAGADIVLGMGDGSSFGMLQAVETATPPAGADKVWFIDVIGDKSDPAVDPNGVLLSSILWDFTGAFEDAIAQIDAGTFGTSVYTLDVANGGIALLQTPNISADAWTAVQTALAGISDGSISVPVTATEDEVKALLPAQ